MARCNFCQRDFQSSQAVRAHLKHCKRYQSPTGKGRDTSGSQPRQSRPKASPPTPLLLHTSTPIAQPDVTAPLLEFMKSIGEASAKQQGPQSPHEQRRQALQDAKAQAVDQYWTPSGTVTSALRGEAKAAIELKLGGLPLEELPFKEVLELAAASRESVYATAFAKQARKTERQHAKQEARRRKEVAGLGALRRVARRKEIYLQQASHQTLACCEAKGMIGWERLSVLADIKSRLNEFLTGDEPVPDAHAIIQCVCDDRFAEADAKLAAARAKEEQKWREELAGILVLGAGLVMLALKYPHQALPILTWIERIFGLQPVPEAGPTKSDLSETMHSTSSSSASPHRRRRQKPPAPPLQQADAELNIGDRQASCADFMETMDTSPLGEREALHTEPMASVASTTRIGMFHKYVPSHATQSRPPLLT